MIGGAIIGVASSYVARSDFTESSVIISSAVIGSLLPDIDRPSSKIAKSDSLIGLISHLTSKFTRHRGVLHTVFGAATFAALFYGLAAFRTEKESLLSFFLAFSVFILIHVFGGAFYRLAGWAAAFSYIAGPRVAEIMTESNISFEIQLHSARLCALGIFVGCIAHMAYDTFNPGGIAWLWPLSKKNISLLSIKTDSRAEAGFFVLQVLILAVVVAVCYGDAKAVETMKRLFDEVSAFTAAIMR